MKKTILLLSLTTFSNLLIAQVGVNTTVPNATLDITAKQPTGNSAIVDGLLIPRVDRLRAQSMINIPVSTLIYINDISTGVQAGITQNVDTIGYYYFNNLSQWTKLEINTPLLDNADGTYTYTSENGTSTTIKGGGSLTGNGVLEVNAGANAQEALFKNATVSIKGGTNGQVLTTNTAGTPYWQTVRAVRRITTTQAINIANENVILVDASAQPSTATIIVDFPTSFIFQGYVGKTFTVKRVDDGPATVIIRGGTIGTVSLFDETETQITVPPKTAIQLVMESDALTGFKFQTISKN